MAADDAARPALETAPAALVLADGSVFAGRGAGAAGAAVGEVCFNTAITGHQEILSDPSYADQIVCFTASHVGNTGANTEDVQAGSPASPGPKGAVLRTGPTLAASWRAQHSFDAWLTQRNIIAVTDVDTRALTRRIRSDGMAHAVIAHGDAALADIPALAAQARAWDGLEGADLASSASTANAFHHHEPRWSWPDGHVCAPHAPDAPTVVLIDYGVKKDILRSLAEIGARVHVVGARTPAAEILALHPDGVVLSNGPGDPAATAAHAADTIRTLAESGVPLLAICLGHQMLAIALGGRTVKMSQGHHGANHPVQDQDSKAVQIVSMNHGFAVDQSALPPGARESHVSLFDGTNCGLAWADKPIISVQHHPEAAPGPNDALGVFARFGALIQERPASA